MNNWSPPTVLFAPGSLSAPSVVGHAGDAADGICRPALLPLAAPLVLTAEAALGDLQAVSVAVVTSVKPIVAAARAIETVAALSTRAVSVESEQERSLIQITSYIVCNLKLTHFHDF